MIYYLSFHVACPREPLVGVGDLIGDFSQFFGRVELGLVVFLEETGVEV